MFGRFNTFQLILNVDELSTSVHEANGSAPRSLKHDFRMSLRLDTPKLLERGYVLQLCRLDTISSCSREGRRHNAILQEQKN